MSLLTANTGPTQLSEDDRTNVLDSGSVTGHIETVRFDTKIAIIVRQDLADWQKLNLTAFLASGIAAAVNELIGAPYQDGSGIQYLAMFRQPVLVLTGDDPAIRLAFERAVRAEFECAIYTEELFNTNNDADNRAAVGQFETADLKVVGFAVYGDRSLVDRALKGLRLHA
jgi:hypothetical protein